MSYTNWLIGVMIAILGNIVSNLGLNFQKKAHSIQEEISKAIQEDVVMNTEDIKLLQRSGTSSKNASSNTSITLISPHSSTSPVIHSNSKTHITSHNSAASSLKMHIQTPNAPNLKTSDVDTLIELEKKRSYYALHQHKSYITQPMWLFGVLCQMVGALCEFIALGFAPQSVVAPLGSLTLAVNVILAPVMHNEQATFSNLIATLIIIIGTAITVLFSAKDREFETLDSIFDLYVKTEFIVYSILVSLFLLIGYFGVGYCEYIRSINKIKYELDLYNTHCYLITAISGVMGAQNMFLAKSLSLSLGIGYFVVFSHWQFYVILIGLLTSIYLQIKWMNSALKDFSSLYVAPIFQAHWITVTVIGGLVVYKEFQEMDIVQKFVFPIGVAITIIGVIALVKQERNNKL